MYDSGFTLEKILLKIEIYNACVYTANFEFIQIQCESVQKMKTGFDLNKFFYVFILNRYKCQICINLVI